MNLKSLFSGAIALSILGLAGVASADTLTLSNSVGPGIWGSGGFFGLVNLTYTPTIGSPSSFEAYCTDRNVDAYLGNTWGAAKLNTTLFVPPTNSSQYNGGAINTVLGGELAWLVNSYGVTTDNDTAAAVQLAVWDIAEGGNGNALDPVYAWGGGMSAAVLTQSEGYATSAVGKNNVNDWYEAERDQNGNAVSQDFLPPSSTPEPFTMGIGFAGIATYFARRKRSN